MTFILNNKFKKINIKIIKLKNKMKNNKNKKRLVLVNG